MTPAPESIRFNVLRNALYHTARRLRFERLTRWFNLAVILLGASAMSDAFGYFGIPAFASGAAVAVIATLQLVFDFAGSARDHRQLQREYYELLADIEATVDPDAELCARWYSRMIRISGEEPPVMRAVDAKAYNDAISALEWDDDQRLYIPLARRLLKNVLSFEGHSYRKLCELTPKAA